MSINQAIKIEGAKPLPNAAQVKANADMMDIRVESGSVGEQ